MTKLWGEILCVLCSFLNFLVFHFSVIFCTHLCVCLVQKAKQCHRECQFCIQYCYMAPTPSNSLLEIKLSLYATHIHFWSISYESMAPYLTILEATWDWSHQIRRSLSKALSLDFCQDKTVSSVQNYLCWLNQCILWIMNNGTNKWASFNTVWYNC